MDRAALRRRAKSMPKWCAVTLTAIAVVVTLAVVAPPFFDDSDINLWGAGTLLYIFPVGVIWAIECWNERGIKTSQRSVIDKVCKTGNPSGDAVVDDAALRRLRRLSTGVRFDRWSTALSSIWLVQLTIFDAVQYDLRWLLALIVAAPLAWYSLLPDREVASRRDQLELAR